MDGGPRLVPFRRPPPAQKRGSGPGAFDLRGFLRANHLSLVKTPIGRYGSSGKEVAVPRALLDTKQSAKLRLRGKSRSRASRPGSRTSRLAEESKSGFGMQCQEHAHANGNGATHAGTALPAEVLV